MTQNSPLATQRVGAVDEQERERLAAEEAKAKQAALDEQARLAAEEEKARQAALEAEQANAEPSESYSSSDEADAKKECAPEGTLELFIKEANLDRDVDIIGKQDPYVELILPGQGWTWKSQVIDSGGKKPEWNETVSIEVKSL